MGTARKIAEAYFAAALDRGDLEDALRQLRHDVEFASPAAQIRGRDEVRPYLEGFAGAFADARYTINWAIESDPASRSRASTQARIPGRCGCPTARNSSPQDDT
jgi:SnoaL-like protein